MRPLTFPPVLLVRRAAVYSAQQVLAAPVCGKR